MRKYMTKEVTFTSFKIAKMELKDGKPESIVLPEVEMIGNPSESKLQKLVEQQEGKGSIAFDITTYTKQYKMLVEDFIHYAYEVPNDYEEGEE